MFNTGSDFFNVFMHIAAWSPLVPLCIVFFRRLFSMESFSLLMIICVVDVLFSIFFTAIPAPGATYFFFNNIYCIAEFVLLSFLLRSCIGNAQVKTSILFVMGLFVAGAITFNAIKGFDYDNKILYTICSGLLFLESFFVLVVMLIRENNYISLSPLFWMVAGIFFYYGLYGYLSLGRKFFFLNNLTDTQNLWKLIYIISWIKYMFFAIAASSYKHPRKERPIY